MNILSTFRKTEFLKEDNELENKVNVLTELHKKYPDNEKIARDLTLANLGLIGENNIKHELEVANIGMYVLHDITFRYDDLTAQTDFIVITPAKNYFIECKNMIGSITINRDGSFTRQYEYYGHKRKENIYSPLTQAQNHINIYKKIWDKKHNTFDKLFFEKDFYKYNVPLVVFANAKGILKDNFAPKNIKKNVTRADLLIEYLKKDLNDCKLLDRSSKGEMEKIGKRFFSYNAPNNIDYKKIYLTDEEKIIELKNSLIQFRINKSQSRNIPEHYIFDDKELENILNKLPKTIDELNTILLDIKIKYHGEEIIKIINELY